MNTNYPKNDTTMKEIKELKHKKNEANPLKEALYITFWYALLGGLWILFSDSLLNFIVKDSEMVRKIQFLKGWFYVLITSVFIFVIIFYRIKQLRNASDVIYDGYSDLISMQDELIEKDDEIFELSHYDRMTGLLNWSGLSIAFDELIEKNKNEQYVMLYIDIDHIKHVNDTLGHDKGNLVLTQIGEKLSAISTKDDILARVSGDEFIMVFEYDGDEINLHKRVSQITKRIQTTWKFDRYEFFVTASIGVAIYPDNGNILETMIKNADSAMFKAKSNGRNQHYVYDKKISKNTENYIEKVSEIRHGISKDEFVLYYQPLVSLRNGDLLGVEALIRWEHPKKGFLTPYHFIDIAEESGQINEIGKWVFETACMQCQKWHEDGENSFKVSINLSGKRLFNKDLVTDMKDALSAYNIDPKNIQIEITETSVIENLNKAIVILNDIRALGITLALDDFGTGYSSLTYLQMFPIQVLKIDKEFISNISVAGMEKENEIINAVINLAHTLGLEVVAEGIETAEQAEYLLINDCDLGQGYYYDKPMAVKDFNKKYFKS